LLSRKSATSVEGSKLRLGERVSSDEPRLPVLAMAIAPLTFQAWFGPGARTIRPEPDVMLLAEA